MRRFAIILLIVSSAPMLSSSLLVSGQKHVMPQPSRKTAVEGNQEDEFYVCPMHADVTSDSPGKCTKCGMTLVRTARPETKDYEVRITATPKVVKPGETFRLTFFVTHPKSGAAVKDFNIVHEMPFHLFMVSQDLTYFAHIHPQQQANGSFAIDTMVPKAGAYIIYCDIFPVGGMPQVAHLNLVTAGFAGDLFAAQARLEPDKVLSKTVDGVRFELQLDPSEPVGGKPATLKYRLTDEKTGEPITDLQPYLGAWGHALIVSEDASESIHAHTAETGPNGVARQMASDFSVTAFFPRPGRYRIWSQFQRQGQVITVPFTIAVKSF